jgi:hypothetical protein
MPRPIRYQARYDIPAEELFSTLVSREYLQAKLDQIGGNDARLIDLAADDESAKYSLRQGVSRENLPAPVQKLLRGDLVIERTETWHRTADGHEGNVTARVKDAPGAISGTLRVGADGESGSRFVIDGETKIDVPLIGGRIEEAISEQVVRLMEREARFTREWLAR